MSVRPSVREHVSGRIFEVRAMKFGLWVYFLICKVKFVNEQNRSRTSGSSHRALLPENVENGISSANEVAGILNLAKQC